MAALLGVDVDRTISITFVIARAGGGRRHALSHHLRRGALR